MNLVYNGMLIFSLSSILNNIVHGTEDEDPVKAPSLCEGNAYKFSHNLSLI